MRKKYNHYRNGREWWGYVKAFIRKYGMVKKGDLNEISNAEWREIEAVERALAITQEMENAKERLELVELVFWKKSNTLQGAAMRLNISEHTAQRYHSDFIQTVAKEFGLMDK